jgi:transforming growth factor-beta-induced protein
MVPQLYIFLVASASCLASAADLVATANTTGNHNVLVEALTKANLVTTLQGAGPFTVFAPTDAAFIAALAALNITKQQLLDRADLADILTYHVLSGSTVSSALAASQTVNTVNGLPVTITKTGAGVKFATANVTGADVAATNGVIHVIDQVIIPPTLDIVSTAMATGNHNVLAEALTKANLVTTLQEAGPSTVFAPTDAAFIAALAALNITKQQLLDRADLADILRYHVLNGKILSSSLQSTQAVATLLTRATVTITSDGGVVKFATATVSRANILATNGVIHAVDAVVLPPADDTELSAASSSMLNFVATILIACAPLWGSIFA